MMLTGICCCYGQAKLIAQYLPKSIAPYRIEIGYVKTSNLIFPSAIKSVDRGSSLVLVQKAPGVENILQIKAAEPNFKETNVTVVTADGHFYSFEVDYNDAPTTLNFSFVGDSSEKAMVRDQPVSEASFINAVNVIKGKKYSLHKQVREQGIKLRLLNIFVRDDKVYLEIGIANGSLIPFTPSYVRFFLQDKKKAKRTATQEIELIPLYHSPLEKVEKEKECKSVFAFAAFTVPNTKEWVIQLGEKGGSRSLTLHLTHHNLQKARLL